MVNTKTDIRAIKGNSELGIAGGAAAGAGIGALVGSIVPVVGNAIGAAVGAGIGAIAGGIAGNNIGMNVEAENATDQWLHEVSCFDTKRILQSCQADY